NLVAFVILSRGKCGLSTCITRYLVGMAAADLLVIISNPLLRRVGQHYFPQSFLHITPVCSLTIVLLSTSTHVSVWLTVAFTFDRFVAICCEKLKTKYCTKETAGVVIGTVSVMSCLASIPWYFIYKPSKLIDGVPWFCVVTREFYTSVAWGTFDVTDRILTPCIPIFLVLLLNGLTTGRILAAGIVRRRLRGSSGEKGKDPEMEKRNKSIVLLFSITGSFILLWITQLVFMVYRRIATVQSYISYSDPNYITEQISFMLQVLSTCTNTCIYVLTQSQFREELKKAVKYPLNAVVKLIKP
ncbi:G-protein coupled receptor 15-like, partial [Leucoraja erinacea]|uniref:G-protein coupled receptor 15-like n=1 Tax=Leucoraja erinaceus TaxID=7782 RepID=UPI002456810C